MKLRFRPTAAAITFFILFFGGYALYRLVRASQWQIPEEFVQSRSEGALMAQMIVSLSGEVSNELQRINELDKDRRYEEALTAVTELATKNGKMREEAVNLSRELERMTKSLSEIRSPEARDLALEAINNRLALIIRLISYNDGIMRLLGELRLHFVGASGSTDQVSVIINRINLEVAAINDFNRRATEAMDRFDRATK
ncbi:MAG: hypothetical protein AAB495_01085 [Patescibacteria group bacterium]